MAAVIRRSALYVDLTCQSPLDGAVQMRGIDQDTHITTSMVQISHEGVVGLVFTLACWVWKTRSALHLLPGRPRAARTSRKRRYYLQNPKLSKNKPIWVWTYDFRQLQGPKLSKNAAGQDGMVPESKTAKNKIRVWGQTLVRN